MPEGPSPKSTYVIGVDTGGTFTDCVIIDAGGTVHHDKAPTTPDALERGVLAAVANTAAVMGLSAADVLGATDIFAHGTTAALNTLVARTGRSVGLITTRGHEDVLLIGRIRQKVASLSEAEMTDAASLDKAEPLVPRWLTRGVTERVDYAGRVVVPLDEASAVQAIDALLAEGVEAIAVSLLWSFMYSDHERAVADLIRARRPDLFVTLSSDLAPLMKEYERTATTAINAYVGERVASYLGRLGTRLRDDGLRGQFFLMQSMGGVLPAAEAEQKAVNLLASGPVGGVIGTALIGSQLGYSNVISTDVGGTSFDVGLVIDGRAEFAAAPTVARYDVLIPTVDVVSVGAGGGSIAWLDTTGRLHVGPRSAGASPGPACYGHGGTEPTVTDADLVLGRLSPAAFFGGRMPLDVQAAERAIAEHIATPLGLNLVEAAQGIVDIVDAQMADLVRKVTLERGHDPREFVIFAYGGGGPVHVGAYARDIGAQAAVITPVAPVFSAFGIASADLVHRVSRSRPMTLPIDAAAVDAIFADLEAQAREQATAGAAGPPEFSRWVEMRYKRQTHELRVPMAAGPVGPREIDALLARFDQEYERIYGAGTAFREAGIEINSFHVESTQRIPKPHLRQQALGAPDAAGAIKERRRVYFEAVPHDTLVLDADHLRPGHHFEGPALVEGGATSIVVHPGQTVHVDAWGNVIMHFAEAPADA